MEKTAAIKTMRWVYLALFFALLGAVVLLHAIPKPFLDVIRLPTFIRAGEPYLGFPYDSSLLIYQITLLFFVFVTLVDAISLFLFSSNPMKKISAYSSLIGFTLMAAVFMYFLYSFFVIDIENNLLVTVAIYLALSLVLMMLDLLTFILDEQLIWHLGVKKNR